MSDNPVPTFRENVLVPLSRVKKSKKNRKLTRKYVVYIGDMWMVTFSRNISKELPLDAV
jgi:hypothetical protein